MTNPDRRLDPATSAALGILEGRWALRLLTALAAGPARFSELEAGVPGVSRRMLAERLRELENSGLVGRHVDSGPPITSTYALTAEGNELGTILGLVRRWASSRPVRAASQRTVVLPLDGQSVAGDPARSASR